MTERSEGSRLRSLADRPVVRKLARYAAASVVGVVTGQALLLLFYSVLDWAAVAANIVSVAVSSIPAYLVNRYWVWQKRGRNSLRAEVIPFWLMALLGLLLSSLLVAVVQRRTDSALALALASLSGFGVLWIAKFVVLERVLFAPVVTAIEEREAVVTAIEEREGDDPGEGDPDADDFLDDPLVDGGTGDAPLGEAPDPDQRPAANTSR